MPGFKHVCGVFVIARPFVCLIMKQDTFSSLSEQERFSVAAHNGRQAHAAANLRETLP